MSVMAMKRLNICGMKRDRESIIETINEFKAMELDESAFQNKNLSDFPTNDQRITFEKKAHNIENAIEAIEMYAPEKKGMLASLEGKKDIKRVSMMSIVKREDELTDMAKRAMDNMKKIIEDRVEIDRNQVSMQSLEPWLDLDIPMEFTHTERTSFLIGTIVKVDSQEEIYDGIGLHLVDLSEVEISIVHKDKFQTCIVAVCLKEYENAVENGLHTLGFARISNAFKGIPREELDKLKDDNEKLQREIEILKAEFNTLAEKREDLKILSDYYRIEASKQEGMGKSNDSASTFFISGYVPEKVAGSLVKKLNKKFNLYCELENVKEDEDSPVLMQNSGIGQSVEGIVESYGLPNKKEIDPSKIVSWFYVFLFGLMLSDAAYGLIMFISCAVLLKKYKKMEHSMRKSIKLFMYCGISTLMWGILFGGYFGDAVETVSKTFFGHAVTVKPLWFAPLSDPMKLLLYCMLFGIIHLFVGLAVKGYMCIRDREYLNFFCDVVLWFSLLVGLIMLLLPTELFYSLSQLRINFGPVLTVISKILAIGGALGILVMAGRNSKKVGLRLALGAYDLYNLTGWLSDLLSYSRLLALGLATGVIASVINQIGSMGGNSIVGIILFIIVFIFGHIFNMSINILGAYVHTNRLQYVEFFGKFYEGGGREFHPFRSETKYVDIEEES